MSSDSLGDRMKKNYEDRTRYYLPRRTYTLLRLDGKAFHTWTRGLDRPYDRNFQELLDITTRIFCSKVMGAVFAYTQSDEVSVLLIDFDPDGVKVGTSAWFDGNIQKICSVGASMFTAIFNDLSSDYIADNSRERGPAMFDCRVFTIADPVEVYNYFVWRQQDATRNSIQASAQFYYSHNECMNMNCSKLQDMLMAMGMNWNDYPTRFKRGGMIYYDRTMTKGEALNKRTSAVVEYERPIGWSILRDIPIFTSDDGKKFLLDLIPRIP